MYINVYKSMYMIQKKKTNINKHLPYCSHGKDKGINID